jgi:Na+/H+ antiporter NhaD/arsenite permease-like protein
MNNQALISLLIFIFVYALIICDLLPRSIVSLGGAVVLFILGVIKDREVVSLINWEAMGLIFGMFILVRILVESGFFDVLSSYILKLSRGKATVVFLSLSIATGIMAAFMDSITVMLFMATLSIEVSRKLKTNPVPFVLSQITAANIGGSATLMGDPPNVILGTGLGITLVQYVKYLAPISLLTLLINGSLFLLTNKYAFRGAKDLDIQYIKSLKPLESAKNRYMLLTGAFSFLITIFLLIFHKDIGLTVGHVGIIGATIGLVLNGKRIANIWEKIDWEVIVFFATLFIIIGALETTGVIKDLANTIVSFTKESAILTKNVLLWTSGILSGFIDNVPFAASMVPLIKSLSGKVPLRLISMGLITSFGTDVGGNFTPIGASANVVGLAILRNAGIEVTWKDYIKQVLPITALELIIADLLFLLLYR